MFYVMSSPRIEDLVARRLLWRNAKIIALVPGLTTTLALSGVDCCPIVDSAFKVVFSCILAKEMAAITIVFVNRTDGRRNIALEATSTFSGGSQRRSSRSLRPPREIS